MKKSLHKTLFPWIILNSLLSFFVLLFVHLDTTFSYEWLTFFLWVGSVFFMPIVLSLRLRKTLHKVFTANVLKTIAQYQCMVIACAGILFSFLFLPIYPFVINYDQVRDGGLNAMELASGLLKNPFGFGRYASHGLIIPTLTLPFYLLFHGSALTFRLPDALLAVTDALLLYIIAGKMLGRRAALLCSLILLSLPLHLYYARTEIVPFFSDIFMTGILALWAMLFTTQKKELYIVFGLVLGVGACFHDSIKTVIFLTIFLLTLLSLVTIVKKKNIKQEMRGLVFLFLFFIIGYGPKVLFLTPDIFFHTSETFTAHTQTLVHHQKTFATTIPTLLNNYVHSLLVYGIEPTRSTHYAAFSPLLDPLLACAFLLGIFTILLRKPHPFLRIVLTYALLIPFTNSAITDTINADHRLLPLLPVTALITGYGITVILSVLKHVPKQKMITALATVIIVAMLLIKGLYFFVDEPANKPYTPDEYLSMHMLYYIASQKTFMQQEKLCIGVPSSRYHSLQTYGSILLIDEQYAYFLPGKTVTVYEGTGLPENSIYLSKTCPILEQKHVVTSIYCSTSQKFVCPKETPLTLFVEDPLSKTSVPSSVVFSKDSLVLPPVPQFIP